jgi:probable F420-dependent oxidoreductase
LIGESVPPLLSADPDSGCGRRRCAMLNRVTETIELSLQAVPTERTSWLELARRCESSGFRALLVPDHPGSAPAPFVALAAASAVTSTLRLGSNVVNAGVRDPLLLADDVATLDVVSGGRAELGIGAGHTPDEWSRTGRERPGPKERVERMITVAGVVQELLAGRTVPAAVAGGARTDLRLDRPRPVQASVPLLVGGGHPELLRWGSAHADAVGLSGLGRTLPDGHDHTVSWSAAQVDRQVDLVRSGAKDAGRPVPPLEALVQRVEVTDDREAVAAPLATEFSLPAGDLLAVPYTLIGTLSQIVEQIRDAQERWGFHRWVVRLPAIETAEQIIGRLRS